MRQTDIRRRVPTMQELAALGTITQIDHRYRYIRDLLIPIESFVYQRVRECGDDEDHRHSRVTEDALQLRYKGSYYLKFDI